MSRGTLSAAKAVVTLTAVGLLLSACYYPQPYYGAPHFGQQRHGQAPHHQGRGKPPGYGHHTYHGHRGYYGY